MLLLIIKARLSQPVDDTVWNVRIAGQIFATDSASDSIDVITGSFPRLIYVAVTPCHARNAPPAYPAPGFPPNYLGALNQFTGHVSRVPVTGVNLQPNGMIFLPSP